MIVPVALTLLLSVGCASQEQTSWLTDEEAIRTQAWLLETSPVDLGYEPVANWIQPPADVTLTAVTAVAVDSKDQVWLLHRGEGAAPVQCYSSDGEFLFSWDDVDIGRAHMINFDDDDNVWISDDGDHAIYKFSPDGELLLALGEQGVAGSDNEHFEAPSDVDFDAAGAIYVTDGNRRIVKFSPDGEFIESIGRGGHGIGEFQPPHTLTVDADDTVFVSDRNMWRVQLFDEVGDLEDVWSHIGRVSDIVEDENGDYYALDAEVGRITKVDRSGEILGWFGEPGSNGSQLADGHSIDYDSRGNITVAHLDGRVTRFARSADQTGDMAGRGQWSTLSTNGNPSARHEASMVSMNGKGYLMGGRGIKPVEEFDPATGSWRQLKPVPLEIHHFQPVVYEDKIYIMTAMTGQYPKETPLESIYIYDPAADTWEKGPIFPKHRRRGGAGTVVHDGKIYMVAGIIDGHTSGTIPWFDEFDPKTGEWRELEDAPHARDHFPAIELDGRVYAIGGRSSSYHEPDNFAAFFSSVVPEVDVYDFSTQEWKTLPEGLHFGTAAGGLLALDGDIYYFGGESYQRLPHRATQRLDVETGTWKLMAPLQRARHGGGAIEVGGKFYFTVGSGGRGSAPELSSTEVFTLNPAAE